MRRFFVFLAWLSLSYFNFGCYHEATQTREDLKRENNNMDHLYNNLDTLTDFGTVSFAIDSNFSGFPRCSQYYTDDSLDYFSFLDRHTNTIAVYSNDDGAALFKINIPKNGENNIGGVAEGFYIKNFDSIFVFSRYTMGIYNRYGKLSAKFDFLKLQGGLNGTSLLQLGSVSRPAFYGDYMYMNNVPDIYASKQKGFRRGKICGIKIDLKKPEDISHLIRYPYPYQIGVYGPNFIASYNTYNEKRSLMVFSFPADNYILTYNILTDSTHIYYAGGRSLDSIVPMPKPSGKFDVYNKFFLKSPSYASIFFDSYRNVYYRFALRPISDEDYQKRRWWKRKSIVILDSSFNKIGESPISDSCSFVDGFVTKDGLYLNCSPNEDTLRYRRYTLSRIRSKN